MRMKMVCDDRTLAEVANEFLALKKAQKVRERTLNDYKKYIDKFPDFCIHIMKCAYRLLFTFL